MVCAPVRRDNPELYISEGIIERTGALSMLYLTCTMISSVDHAHYGVFRAKDWVSGDCGTKSLMECYFLTQRHLKYDNLENTHKIIRARL